ncbi:MAG: serine/threonine protein kinase [Deltaproteobacteria bacterium HGW-Deltaproteobacteria-20]|jgi:serine/threonine-protein kinase|nr:MAG: serine/threonine protein kinase [Deltaproteobacteria bacterium HGW-Deltaproteobacteria-20]
MTVTTQFPGLEPGTVLADKYRVERVLGRGGMGVVVAATHLRLEQTVAIKVLQTESIADAVTVERFLREARAAARIESEHVARVFDVGLLDPSVPYIVMEYLSGKDLSDRETCATASLRDIVDWVMQACEAVAEAHAHGIVHRDLKPANLFLAKRLAGPPVVKVLDFGLAKAPPSDAANGRAWRTQSFAVMGTPRYMSPEQMRCAKQADERSDIWSMGAVLFEMLTGKPAFDAQSLAELCAMVAADPLPSLRDLRPEIPEGLEHVVAWCMEKRPEDRPQTMAALAEALVPFGSEYAASSAEKIRSVLGTSAYPAPYLAHSSEPPMPRPPAARGRFVALLVSALAALALLAGVGAVLWGRSVPQDSPPDNLATTSASGPHPLPSTAESAEPAPAPYVASASGSPSVASSRPVRPTVSPAPPTPSRSVRPVPRDLDEEPLLDRQ